ncbi:MAG: efflux RND transporter periplasmic adaptor subunit [Saprospiraceae bacterium]
MKYPIQLVNSAFAKTSQINPALQNATRTYRMKSLSLLTIISCLAMTLVFSSCGGETEFKVPETREEQLALLDAKKREIREINTQIAELERAAGEDDKAISTRLVKAQKLETINFRREIELQASVESDETAVVTVEIPGRVTAVLVKDGQYVKKGQTVVRIDLESVNVQKAELNTNLSLAKDILARQERLRAQNIGTELQLLEAQNTVDRLNKALEQLDLNLAKSAVKAPISGTVEQKMINAGEYAAPGMPLMQILDVSSVKIVADVPESYLRSVKKGQKVRVEFPNIDMIKEARVTDIGRSIDAANRTFRVELEMSNRDRMLKPNMLASVYLVDYQNDNVIMAGSETILEEIDGREYIYIAKPMEGKKDVYVASKAYVQTGENDALRREITGGAKPGELLITEGMRSLTNGEAITLQVDKPVAKASAN